MDTPVGRIDPNGHTLDAPTRRSHPYGMVWYGMAWYGMVEVCEGVFVLFFGCNCRKGYVDYDMTWCGKVWYDVARHATASSRGIVLVRHGVVPVRCRMIWNMSYMFELSLQSAPEDGSMA